MGCWNHTCALTNLPICAGEEVVVLLLVEQLDKSHHCYPTTYFKPIPFYFNGIYDDYGSAEECHGPTLDLIISEVKEHLFEMEMGENEYHDIAVKKEGFDIDKLFLADHEDRLFLHASPFWARIKNVDKVRLKHIVIRKNVFDQIISRFKLQTYIDNHYVDFTVQDVIDDGITWLDEVLNGTNQDIWWLMNMIVPERDKVGHKFYWVLESTKMYDYVKPFYELVEQTKENRESLNIIVKQMCEIYWLNSFMNHGRNQWIAPSGSGSQNDDTKAQRLLSEITLEEAEKFDHRWDDE